jgi:hypothetical protein
MHTRPWCITLVATHAGKTSLVKALAGSLGLSIYVITLSSSAITDDTLRELLSTTRDRGILLLEDVDAAFGPKRRVGAQLPEGRSAGLSFSGLLNAVDGVAAQEGKLLFMTTNHVDDLDLALIRPGRVDVRCEFQLCSREQVKQLFLRFYTQTPPQQPILVGLPGVSEGDSTAGSKQLKVELGALHPQDTGPGKGLSFSDERGKDVENVSRVQVRRHQSHCLHSAVTFWGRAAWVPWVGGTRQAEGS